MSNADEYAKIKATHPHVKVCLISIIDSCVRAVNGWLYGWMDGRRTRRGAAKRPRDKYATRTVNDD